VCEAGDPRASIPEAGSSLREPWSSADCCRRVSPTQGKGVIQPEGAQKGAEGATASCDCSDMQLNTAELIHPPRTGISSNPRGLWSITERLRWVIPNP
jgi:hypothetical protein